MQLVGGDVLQYKELRRSSMGDYLIKLDNFATINEASRPKSAIKLPGVK